MRRGRRQVARTVAHSVGGEAAGLAAAGRGVGRVRSPKPRERTPGERPDRHGSAGIAGGALDGGDHHRSGRRRAAGLVKVPQVGGEARIVERSSIEPGVELAAGHGRRRGGCGGDVARSRSTTGASTPDRGTSARASAGSRGGTDRTTGYVIGHIRDRFPIR